MEPGRREGNMPGKEVCTPKVLLEDAIEATTVHGKKHREQLQEKKAE